MFDSQSLIKALAKMNSVKQRIYVGNLPFDITDEEVSKKFSKYGNVLKVEMKHRSDPFSDVGLPCYAFLDLQIEPPKLDKCFRKVSSKKWRGHSIKLELAKESFLSRLEKERLETSSKPVTAPKEICVEEPTDHKRKKKGTDQKNKSGSDDAVQKSKKRVRLQVDASVDEACQDNSGLGTTVLEKFESFSDVWKDAPTQEFNGTKGKVVDSSNLKKTRQNSERKETDEKILSEEKRLKSLKDKKKSFIQQKEAVKLALSMVDVNRPSKNRLVFNDDDNEDGIVPTTAPGSTDQPLPSLSESGDQLASSSSTKPRLFDENESGDEEEKDIDFKIKKQFEGKKGQKLLELQSQYANDQRFALDERFYDSDDNAEQHVGPADEDNISGNDEMKRQLEILQNIVGHELPRVPQKKVNLKGTSNFMLRFDPTNVEHAQYERKEAEKSKPVTVVPSKPVQKKTTPAEKKKKKLEAECADTTSKVSKDTFYKVADTLTESLKTKENGGFSLLKMFGSTNDNDIEETSEDVPSTSVPLSKNSMDWTSNPFTHDSSESETEEVATTQPTLEPVLDRQGTTQACGIWRDTFFFKTDDARLLEGLEFFGKKNDTEENFSQRRKELKQIITAKVKHNLRKSQPKKQKLGGTKFNRFRDTKKKNRVGTGKFKKFRKK